MTEDRNNEFGQCVCCEVTIARKSLYPCSACGELVCLSCVQAHVDACDAT